MFVTIAMAIDLEIFEIVASNVMVRRVDRTLFSVGDNTPEPRPLVAVEHRGYGESSANICLSGGASDAVSIANHTLRFLFKLRKLSLSRV